MTFGIAASRLSRRLTSIESARDADENVLFGGEVTLTGVWEPIGAGRAHRVFQKSQSCVPETAV